MKKFFALLLGLLLLCGAALAEEVTKEDVIAVAQSVDCDLIYFLKGGEPEEDADGD